MLPIHSFNPSGSLAYGGGAVPADGGVQVTLTARNGTRDMVRVSHGACSFAVWVYASGARAGRPAWDNRLPANAACVDIGLGFVVAPGTTYEVPVGRYTAARVLGDSLPAGRYYFTVVLRNGRGRLTAVPAGDATFTR